MKLSGIEIHNFRSIGGEPVVLNPWRKCNILVGRNNAGKSNVIKAIQRIASIAPSVQAEWVTEDDLHRRSPDSEFEFTLHFERDAAEEEKLAQIAGTSSFDFRWKCTPKVVPT